MTHHTTITVYVGSLVVRRHEEGLSRRVGTARNWKSLLRKGLIPETGVVRVHSWDRERQAKLIASMTPCMALLVIPGPGPVPDETFCTLPRGHDDELHDDGYGNRWADDHTPLHVGARAVVGFLLGLALAVAFAVAGGAQ